MVEVGVVWVIVGHVRMGEKHRLTIQERRILARTAVFLPCPRYTILYHKREREREQRILLASSSSSTLNAIDTNIPPSGEEVEPK